MNRAPDPPRTPGTGLRQDGFNIAPKAPAPPPPMPRPGTLEWVAWHKAQSLTPQDGQVLDAIVALVTAVPYGAHMDAHAIYSLMAVRLRWPGWKAALMWELIKASIPEDEIPF